MASADRVVLITGVGRYLGARIAARLAADTSIGRIIGVDTVPPMLGAGRIGRTEFVRADIRNPLIGKVLDQAHVDVVVHPGVSQPSQRRAHSRLRSEHLAGTAQLLDACERSTSVRRVVAASTTNVYGSSHHDPAVFTEEMGTLSDLPPGRARDAVEVEDKLRAFARRRPDVMVSVLRLASLIGPAVDTWLTRYLALPVVLTALGYDPRLQLLHEQDAIEVFHRASVESHPGVINVAGDGVVTLAQMLRWSGRVGLPLPGGVVGKVGKIIRPVGVRSEDVHYLMFGRVVDTTRLKTRLGYVPSYTTAEALRAYLETRATLPGLATATVARLRRPSTACLRCGRR